MELKAMSYRSKLARLRARHKAIVDAIIALKKVEAVYGTRREKRYARMEGPTTRVLEPVH